MVEKITEDQYQELLDVIDERRPDAIVRTFEKVTGIVVKPYTAYQFYDAGGDYLGDLNWDDVSDILKAARIKVEIE